MNIGEFLLHLSNIANVRRKCWPNDVYIRYDIRDRNIIRLTNEDYSHYFPIKWEPTHCDLLATDWEIAE